MLLKLSDIQVPKVYVRKRKASHVEYLLEIAKAAQGWPFDPVEVAPNAKPEASANKDKKKPAKKQKPWELLDGQHRIKVAELLKLKEIPAKEKNIKDPGARFLEQYLTNMKHGLRLDPVERADAVRRMVKEFQLKAALVAKETGFHPSSISRILKGKQGIGYAPESMRREKKTANYDGAPQSGGIFTPAQFADHLAIMVSDYPRQKAGIVFALKEKFGDKLNDFFKELAAMLKEIYAQV